MGETASNRGVAARLAGALTALPAAVALLLAVSAPAQAAPALAPEDHAFPAPAINAGDAQPAFAPNGFAAMAWVETLPAGQSRVDVSLRPPGGAWSAPQQLAPSTMELSRLSVAVNAAGAAAVAWQQTTDPSTFVAAVATRPAGGVFGVPETAEDGYVPKVGIDGAGNVTLLYGLVPPAAEAGELVRTAPAGGAVLAGAGHTLSSACAPAENSLAVAPSGDAIAGLGCESVSFALRKGGLWGETSTPFPAERPGGECEPHQAFFESPAVAIDAAGDPVGIAERTDRENECPPMGFGGSESNSIFLALPAGGLMVKGPEVAKSGSSFGAAGPIPENVLQPTIGIGGGSLFASWLEADETGVAFQPAVRRYPGNGAGSPTEVQKLGATTELAGEDSISTGAGGSALLTWGGEASSGSRSVMAAFAPAGAGFGSPVQVSDGTSVAEGGSSAGDEGGDALIAWSQDAGTSHVIHARGLEAGPPALGAVSIPAAAQAGRASAFSAQASAVWGPVGFSWSFGDGTAAGGEVSHTFTAAGPHTVILTASDAAGSALTSATVAVSAASSSPTPSSPPCTSRPRAGARARRQLS